MEICHTTRHVFVYIFTLLFTSIAIAELRPVDTMDIIGGSVYVQAGGNIDEVIFTTFGENTNLVGGYIGVGGSTREQYELPDPANIIIFEVFGQSVVTYTAESNLGTTSESAGIFLGGDVPTGMLDDSLNTIMMDLSSWFVNLNNVSDAWAGTGLDDGHTSQYATGIWNPITYEYVLTWNTLVPEGVWTGVMSTWTLEGYAYPVTITQVSIDIKPRKNPKNIIDLRKDKELKVAIVGDVTFDALQVDTATIKFGPSEASPVNFKAQDYNRDGFSDLILIFNLSETGISCGDESATLTGETLPFPVSSITGNDSFTVEPCPQTTTTTTTTTTLLPTTTTIMTTLLPTTTTTTTTLPPPATATE